MTRARKPTAGLKLTGRYRADRHGNRADTLPLRADFVCPFADDGPARELWHKVVGEFAELGIVKANDADALRALCESWALYRAAFDVAIADPIDQHARLAVTSYFQTFWRGATAFGLTPISRAGIKVEKKPAANPIARKRG